MKNMLKNEMKRMLRSKGFLISIILGIIIVILHTRWIYVHLYVPNKEMLEVMLQSQEYGVLDDWFECGILQGWLGNDGFSLYNAFFYFIFPVISVMPYGMSLYHDINSGYISSVLAKGSRRDYLVSKYTVTFISGGIVVAVPLILSIMTAACYLPAVGIDLLAMKGGSNMALWHELFFEHPVLYAVCFIVLNFIYGGIFALICVTVSKWFSNRFMAALFPFILNMFTSKGLVNVFPQMAKFMPGYFINPSLDIAITMGCVVLVTAIVLGLTTLVYYLNYRNLEVLE
ncbi:MAG: hypothetical protein NC225_09995 [Clostridium sp.]|nr:hypothetical protein [Clostridium sp.]MCM1399795.1 hypothetical protein [Clostridium sp.]MCM1459578.1 hypothetical protein [Bacteroides sp.]